MRRKKGTRHAHEPHSYKRCIYVTPLIYSNVGYVAAWWLYGPHLTLSVHSYSWLCESFNFQLEKFSLKVYWKFEYSLVRSYCNGVQRTQLRRQAGQRRRFEACNQVTPLRYQLTTKIQSWLCKLVPTTNVTVPTYIGTNLQSQQVTIKITYVQWSWNRTSASYFFKAFLCIHVCCVIYVALLHVVSVHMSIMIPFHTYSWV